MVGRGSGRSVVVVLVIGGMIREFGQLRAPRLGIGRVVRV
jgi:hypothetical protein